MRTNLQNKLGILSILVIMLTTGVSCATFRNTEETSLFFCLYQKKQKIWKCSNSSMDYTLEKDEDIEDLVCMPSIDHQNYVWGCEQGKKGSL